MSTEKSNVEPWQLILIIVLMIAFFGGLYVVNQAISARIDSLETTIDGKIEMVGRNVERLENKLMRQAAERKAAAAAIPPQPVPAR